jgi:hypothetical protein
MYLNHVSKSDSMGGAMDAMELGISSNGFGLKWMGATGIFQTTMGNSWNTH